MGFQEGEILRRELTAQVMQMRSRYYDSHSSACWAQMAEMWLGTVE